MNWMRVAAGLTACAALTVAGCADTTDRVLAPDDGAAPAEVTAPLFRKSAATGNRYVLVAGKWTKAQTRAVEAAGGTVTLAHKKTGIGAVTSDASDFLEQVLSTGAFAYGFVDESVVWQEPQQTIRLEPAAVTPEDEWLYNYQWNMWAIDAPDAWASGADGSGARVAVIDGGLWDVHPDIAPNLDAACSTSFVPEQPFNFDTGTFWHGTHVAGIILAADNGFGVIGVAPEATLMHVKALHSGRGSFSWIINAILFASDPASFAGYESCDRADIINMSLGALFPKRATRGSQAAITKAVNFAASKGVLVISSAGNDALDMGQLRDWVTVPAQSGSGLAVAATGPVDFANGGDNYRRFASYSNWGEDLVFVAAPGGDFTLYSDGLWYLDMVLSTSFGGWSWAAGTSMAAPAAAGVAALIVGQNPGISLGRLKTMLKNSADDEGKKGKDEFYGHGFVNAYNAVN